MALWIGPSITVIGTSTVATPPPPVQQSTAPSTEEIVPAAAPQSQAEGESDMMTLPAEPSVAKGSGGCAHGKTVYLTN